VSCVCCVCLLSVCVVYHFSLPLSPPPFPLPPSLPPLSLSLSLSVCSPSLSLSRARSLSLSLHQDMIIRKIATEVVTQAPKTAGSGVARNLSDAQAELHHALASNQKLQEEVDVLKTEVTQLQRAVKEREAAVANSMEYLACKKEAVEVQRAARVSLEEQTATGLPVGKGPEPAERGA
jgi:peptidoglycan hydrolase CwlO-like protein